MVEATPAEQIWEGPICVGVARRRHRPPLNHWSQGRVTLLGDAAHPMAPAMGQGANTTFEDAYELGECFSHSANFQEARTYASYISTTRNLGISAVFSTQQSQICK